MKTPRLPAAPLETPWPGPSTPESWRSRTSPCSPGEVQCARLSGMRNDVKISQVPAVRWRQWLASLQTQQYNVNVVAEVNDRHEPSKLAAGRRTRNCNTIIKLLYVRKKGPPRGSNMVVGHSLRRTNVPTYCCSLTTIHPPHHSEHAAPPSHNETAHHRTIHTASTCTSE